jgi:hypothetical protein
MRLDASEKPANAEAPASPVEAAWSASEMLTVAAGGLAMLLVVGVLDALNLLS